MTRGLLINKKLIVYGDSFADSNIHRELFPKVKHWFHHLVEHYTGQPYDQPLLMRDQDNYDYLNRGANGTSVFFSLWRFLEDLDVYSPEKIVFLFADPRRTPLAKGPIANMVFQYPDSKTKNIDFKNKVNIRHQGKRTNDDKQKINRQYLQIQMWWRYFADEEPLIQFIQQSIFDRVQLECKKRNIDLVFIETIADKFEPIRIDFKYLEYPLIRNLHSVSSLELAPYIDGNLPVVDLRAGHLNRHNNKLCADEIIKCFEDKIPRLINFDEVLGLDYSEDAFNIFFKIQPDGSIITRY